MTFGRGQLSLQKYIILKTFLKKLVITTIVTLKVYDMNIEKINMSR